MKIAIMNYAGKLPNKGGPTGYLYNLYLGAQGIKTFPEFISVENFEIHQRKTKRKLESDKEKNVFIMNLEEYFYFWLLGIRLKKRIGRLIQKYDIIHVHSSQDVYFLRKLCNYKGKIIFTSHRPEPYLNEARVSLKGKNGFFYKLLKKFYVNMEKESYRLADGFIFPSVNSKNIYNKFPGFLEGSKNKPIEYLYTGTIKKDITLSKEKYRKLHNIPLDKFMITFIGRHTAIKGYDRLINIYPELKKNHVQVVVAGAKTNIQYPVDEGWIELGYITDTQNLMNASDIVVIPNRNTYYDLVVIEALSLGCIVISSDTGGNIDIAQKTKGLILFDNNNDNSLLEKILFVSTMKKEELKSYKESALEFYSNFGNNKKFAENYMTVLNSICKEIKK